MSLTAITFLAGFVIGCALAFVRHPIYGLLVYVATLYFDPSGHWWGGGALQGVRWEFVAAGVTLIAMVVHRRDESQFSTHIFRLPVFWGFVAFVVWIAIQSLWSLDPASNDDLLWIWVKFLIVMIMICGCVDSWRHFRLFMWAQVLGCTYLGWLAYSTYSGGRFQGFASHSALGEANYGALMLVIGLIVALALFLGTKWRERAGVLAAAALMADGVVTTVSRSGFLAAATSLLAFNIFTPKAMRLRVILLSVLAIAGFLRLAPPFYWHRIQTVKYEGAVVKGVDTGAGRLAIIRAQMRMFRKYPLGCGAGCTTVLSRRYIPARYLSSEGQRASHNTFMSMLVDHGVPGAVLYILLLMWVYTTVIKASRYNTAANKKGFEADEFPSTVLPALAAVMMAITVGDLFVQYTKLEPRVWFVSLLIVYMHLRSRDAAMEPMHASEAVGLVAPGVLRTPARAVPQGGAAAVGHSNREAPRNAIQNRRPKGE